MKGSIRERKPGVWQITVSTGKDAARNRYGRTSRTVRGNSRAAHRALRALVEEVEAGRHTGSSTTLGELLTLWLAENEGDWSPTTTQGYRSKVERNIRPALGGVMLRKLDVTKLDTFYATLTNKHEAAPATVRQHHAIIRRALGEAVRKGWLTANPAANARLPRARKTDLAPPPPEAVQELLEAVAVTDPTLGVFLHLASVTGARRGEVAALRWPAVEWEDASIVIRRSLAEVRGAPSGIVEKDTKTHQARRIGLDADTLAILKDHRARAVADAATLGLTLADDGFLFPSDVEGRQPTRPGKFTKAWRDLADAHGVQGRLHDLRHGLASYLLATGTPLKSVSVRLGHANASTTLGIYTHAVPAADRDAAEAAGRMLRPTPQPPPRPLDDERPADR